MAVERSGGEVSPGAVGRATEADDGPLLVEESPLLVEEVRAVSGPLEDDLLFQPARDVYFEYKSATDPTADDYRLVNCVQASYENFTRLLMY